LTGNSREDTHLPMEVAAWRSAQAALGSHGMKVMIADDHWIVRESLKQVIRRLNGVHSTLEAGSFEEVVDLLRANPDVDLVLADLIMPGFNDFDGLERLRREFPTVPIAIISVHEDREHVLRAVMNGVIGYIPKSASGPEIERALERILAGEVYFPRRLIESQSGGGGAQLAPAAMPSAEGLDALTPREREVVGLLGNGMSVQRIADQLELSSHTVRVHLGNVMRKMGLPDRAATIHFAVRMNHSAAGGGQRP
jgi:DNA-binding NarL/FixJ family response regulator